MLKECLTAHDLEFIEKSEEENDALEGEDMFIFMYKLDSWDLSLNNVPADYSCIRCKDERIAKSNLRWNSRSLIQIPCKSRSSVDLVVFS